MKNRLRLEFATEGFLAQMRRAAASQAGAPAPKSLAEYPPAHRSALMNAVAMAIELASAGRDKAFEEWLAKRLEEQNPSEPDSHPKL